MAKRSEQGSEKNVATDQNKADKKARGRAKRLVKKQALMSVLAFVKENTKDEKLLLACVALTPGVRFGGVRSTKKDVIVEAFGKKAKIHENEIWENYKLGRSEMRKTCINLIKRAEPKDRVWIDFDPQSGNYTLRGRGPDAPDKWTGYLPVDMKEMEI